MKLDKMVPSDLRKIGIVIFIGSVIYITFTFQQLVLLRETGEKELRKNIFRTPNFHTNIFKGFMLNLKGSEQGKSAVLNCCALQNYQR